MAVLLHSINGRPQVIDIKEAYCIEINDRPMNSLEIHLPYKTFSIPVPTDIDREGLIKFLASMKEEKALIIDLDKVIKISKIESNRIREKILNRLIEELRETWDSLIEQAKRELREHEETPAVFAQAIILFALKQQEMNKNA